MVFSMESTNSEIAEILDTKHIAIPSTGYTLRPSNFKSSELYFMLKSLLSDDVIVDITIDDITLNSQIPSNKIKGFTKKPFF